jgi:hypothetical protein
MAVEHNIVQDKNTAPLLQAILNYEVENERKPNIRNYLETIDATSVANRRATLLDDHRHFVTTHMEELKRQWNERAKKNKQILQDPEMGKALRHIARDQARHGHEPDLDAYSAAIDAFFGQS